MALLGTKLMALAAVGSAIVSSCYGVPTESSRLKKRALKFDYGTEKVRGVNLGGWFVLETFGKANSLTRYHHSKPWITPSIFQEWATSTAVVDEYTYTQTLGKAEATERLSQHWNTWITQEDLYQIAAAGLNHVRIPIGYWSVTPLPGDPYVQGAYGVLGRALDWAQAAGLKVMIDLHGAPGSQNGFDNSGRKGPVDWTKGDTVQQTKNALNKIRDDHASHPAVATIELLNEPAGGSLDRGTIEQFYYDGAGALANTNLATTFHEAFYGVTTWNNFGTNVPNLILDTHHYEVFDAGQLQLSMPDGHVGAACQYGKQMASTNKVTINGEWTAAMTDCAKWLNGLGTGARYDGSYMGSTKVGTCDGAKYAGTANDLTPDEKTALRKYTEAQLDAYEMSDGWIFWTWKTESALEWDLQQLIGSGLFPQPPTQRQFPGQCGY